MRLIRRRVNHDCNPLVDRRTHEKSNHESRSKNAESDAVRSSVNREPHTHKPAERLHGLARTKLKLCVWRALERVPKLNTAPSGAELRLLRNGGSKHKYPSSGGVFNNARVLSEQQNASSETALAGDDDFNKSRLLQGYYF
jgi:hypothetical protein